MTGQPASPICLIELADGTTAEVQPMAPQDAADLMRFHESLTDETTYLRFFAVHRNLSRRELDRFTHVDHHAREAVTATVDGKIVAVARFDRLSDPSEAEAAFVVADPWQGRGLGTALFTELVARARRLGIRTIVADTLASNRRMLAVFRNAGLPTTSTFEGGVVHLRIALEADTPTAPDDRRPTG